MTRLSGRKLAPGRRGMNRWEAMVALHKNTVDAPNPRSALAALLLTAIIIIVLVMVPVAIAWRVSSMNSMIVQPEKVERASTTKAAAAKPLGKANMESSPS